MKRVIIPLAATMVAAAFAQGEPVREFNMLTRPQAAAPFEFQSAQIIAQEWRKLGLQVNVQVMPWEQMSDVVWYERDSWDISGWQMVGRPERSDPDEILFNLFHSSTADDGYNFVGYVNPEYDAVVEAQRVETDPDERQALVHQAQEILSQDQPYMLTAYPLNAHAFRSDVFDPETVVLQSGLGVRNFWTNTQITPMGDVRDIITNSADPVQAINPLYISGGVDSWVFELIWDRLLRIDENGLPVPWAAESYEWVDETTIDVVLRSDMTWHDGEPVTVSDVIFSFDAAGGGEAPMYEPFVTGIESIEDLGDQRIRFNLTEPSAPFLTATLAKINLIPEHIWAPILEDLAGKPENAESYQEAVPIGSGPFRYGNWIANQEVVLEANPDHFAAPKVDRYIIRNIANVEAVLGMIRSGELNFISEYGGDIALLEDVASNGPIELVTAEDIGFRMFTFNTRFAPFDDPAFRRALSFAVSRDLLVQAAFSGYATPANSVVSVALPFWNNPEVNNPATGEAVARQILEEAGYSWDSSGRLLMPAANN